MVPTCLLGECWFALQVKCVSPGTYEVPGPTTGYRRCRSTTSRWSAGSRRTQHPAAPARQAWLGKSFDLQPIPLPFPGRKESSTCWAGNPQGFWHRSFPRIGVSARHAAAELAAATLINTFGNGVLMTTFALYFTRVVGLRPTQVGLALPAGALAGLLVQVPAGHLAYLAVFVLDAATCGATAIWQVRLTRKIRPGRPVLARHGAIRVLDRRGIRTDRFRQRPAASGRGWRSCCCVPEPLCTSSAR